MASRLLDRDRLADTSHDKGRKREQRDVHTDHYKYCYDIRMVWDGRRCANQAGANVSPGRCV